MAKTAWLLFATRTNWDYDPSHMGESNEKPSRYKWPWVAAAAVVLGIVLAVVWMSIAAKKIEREHDWNAPLPGSAPTR
jgi:hypothetical protein